MLTRFLRTHQQQQYEHAYMGGDSEYGIPDRKIADGHVLEGMKILSLGCGSGADIWYLAEANTVVGVDFTESALKVARSHGLQTERVDLNLAPVLPFEDRTFNVVVCKDILEHVLEPLAILQEVHRVLKHDGYAVISVPNHFYLPMRLRILFGKGLLWKSIGNDHSRQYDEWNYMHIRFFTYKGFCRFLKLASFRPEKWFWDFSTLAHYNDLDMWLESTEVIWVLGRLSNGCPRAFRWLLIRVVPARG